MSEITDTTAQCVHHWILSPLQDAEGKTKGSCKLCGMNREFMNAVRIVWEPSARSRGGASSPRVQPPRTTAERQ